MDDDGFDEAENPVIQFLHYKFNLLICFNLLLNNIYLFSVTYLFPSIIFRNYLFPSTVARGYLFISIVLKIQ